MKNANAFREYRVEEESLPGGYYRITVVEAWSGRIADVFASPTMTGAVFKFEQAGYKRGACASGAR